MTPEEHRSPSAPPPADASGTRPAASGRRQVRSVVCTRCACGCDDLDLTLEDGRVVEADNACEAGRRWFLDPPAEDAPPATVDGRPVHVDEAAAAAAALLGAARRPLVWGLVHLASEAQRAAVRLAERLHAAIDPAAGANHPAAVAAFQDWGEVSATLGELPQHQGLLVLWFAEPERTHPRLLERWDLDPADPTRVVRVRHGAASADGWTVPAGREVELLWLMRELAGRAPAAMPLEAAGSPGGGDSDPGPLVAPGGPGGGDSDLRPLAGRLLARLGAAPYALLAFDAAATDATQQHALRAAAATLNGVTRLRLFPLRGPGNRLGAEAVLTWQTGFPVAVDFGAGFPRSLGEQFSAARILAAGAADAALVLCADTADYPDVPAFAALARLPRVVLDSGENSLAEGASVALRSAPYGLASGGTFFRMDGVALGLRPVLPSRYPTEEDWLRHIFRHLPAR